MSVNYYKKTANQIEIKEVIDALISHFKWIYEKLKVSLHFEFLTGEKFSMDTSDFHKAATYLTQISEVLYIHLI